MDLDFQTRTVREGLVDLLVPDIDPRPGPGTRSGLPFYNPSMTVARDISVLLAASSAPPGGRVLDGLAAAGALGLRIAREAGREVVLNDKNPRAVALIRRNLERNGVADATVLGEDLNEHLADHHYDLVEVDPFGSPVPFLDTALRSANRGTSLSATATDTAVLCGAKPEAAWRRYLARVRHTDAYPEIGTRILLGYIVRNAARFDKAPEPILAYAAEHFVKVHVRIFEGAARADRALASLGWVRFDPGTGGHEVLPEDVPPEAIGPLWLGPLADREVLDGVRTTPAIGHAASRILDRVRGEAGLPPFFWDNNAMARRAGVSPPRLLRILEALRELGFRAVPTHFRENAFRTDATPQAVLGLYRRIGG